MSLAVFIDGLGYESACEFGFATLFDNVRPLRPGIGYTVNITTELFAGLQPDDAGFFNKWGIAPERSPLRRLPRMARAALAGLDHWPAADLAVRRTLRRRGADTARIPWRHCATFGKIGHDVLHGPLTERSIVTGPGDPARRGPPVLAHPHAMPGPDDDPAVLDLAKTALAEGRNVLAYLTFLDGLGHDFGPASPEYRERALWYRDRIAELIELSTTTDPGGRVVAISDHSMSAITRHVEPTPAVRRTVAFVDSVMIRAWDPGAAAVVEPLAAYGSVLGEADRERFGVRRREWGDVIFLLEPGSLFVPDFFTGIYRPADQPAKGMHGYHPDREETWGLCGTLNCADPTPRPWIRPGTRPGNGPGDRPENGPGNHPGDRPENGPGNHPGDRPVGTLEAYALLRQMFHGGEG